MANRVVPECHLGLPMYLDGQSANTKGDSLEKYKIVFN
ncbi:hypothetical protein T4A_7310 [Trichinella pseudospiralis]|uniref:Uncharacterized protein n=1 Tax=Trichinella pseudospiralis TaxID=6337 RepID=A0A0V1DS31_TRIPS|nr:hypothetical protein T4A_7310 [Trichinella pseudospiralis]